MSQGFHIEQVQIVQHIVKVSKTIVNLVYYLKTTIHEVH